MAVGPGNRWPVVLAALLPVGIILVTYGGALGADFVFDDHMFLRHWCWQVESFSELVQVPWEPGCGYRRVRYLSMAVDHLLWGPNPVGFHLTNLILHSLVTLLVFGLMRRLGLSVWAASLGALLWGLHPVHTDAVTYAAGRRDLLFTLFFLLALWSWPRHWRPRWRAGVRFVLAVGLTLLALETKEMAVTLPAVLALELLFLPTLLGVPESPWSRLGRVLRRHAAPLVALVAVALAGIVYGGLVRRWAVSPHVLWGGDLFHHVLTIPALYAKYAELVLFPLRLYGDHIDYPPATGWSDVRVWVGGVLLIGVWAGGIGQARRRPYLAFGLLWFGVTMLPVSQIIPHHEILAEHYLYLPLTGLVVPVARGIELAWGRTRWRVAAQVAVSLVAILFALRVMDRNEDFRSERAFAEEILRHVPGSIRGHLTLAHAQQLENRPREAVQSLRWVLEHIDPNSRFYHTASENLLTTLSVMGDLEAAEAQAFQMLQVFPGDPYASRVLGTLRARQGLLDKALAYQMRAYALDPHDVEGRLHLGVTLLGLGRADEAEPHLEYAAQRWRRSPDAQFQWAMAAVQQGRMEVAGRRLEAVLALDADNVRALEQLFVLARDAGDGPLTCAYFRRLQVFRADLRGIDLDCPEADVGEP